MFLENMENVGRSVTGVLGAGGVAIQMTIGPRVFFPSSSRVEKRAVLRAEYLMPRFFNETTIIGATICQTALSGVPKTPSAVLTGSSDHWSQEEEPGRDSTRDPSGREAQEGP
jgi:hypothetical protein